MSQTAMNSSGRGRLSYLVIPLHALLLLWPCFSEISQAQVTSPITSSGLNTQVSEPIIVNDSTQFNITGGTRPGNGPSLFHSFGEFGVPINNIANFLNDTALPTNNILGRVTGGNPSNIFGMIQTTGFGNANLFLINPAGFLFGPRATVNVGGMVAFTSADYLKLSDGARFNTIPNAGTDALLSASPVAAFGFLGSNPGAVTIQGSHLTVTEGTGISLVSGNIEVTGGTLSDGKVQPARLSAPGGQIDLASIASPGEILYPSLQPEPNVNGQSFINMGAITLSEGSILDVSADAAGTIKIRGGEFMIADATISADTVNTNGAPTAVDINVTGDISISNDLAPTTTARTSGSGDVGEIHIASGNLNATSSGLDQSLALIDSHTSGMGKAGNVTLQTGDIQASGGVFFINSGTTGPGHGGDVTVTAKRVELNDADISSGDFFFRDLFDVSGSGGNIKITADSMDLNVATIFTDSALAGRAGDLTLEARNINLTEGSTIGASGLKGSGAITIKADTFVMDSNSGVEADTALAPSGGITVTANAVEIKNASTIRSSTFGDADAGDIHIIATDYATFSDDPLGIRPSGLYSNSFGDVDFGTLGNAGSIVITTPKLELTGGARINSTTQTSGRGGDVTIMAANSISLSGQRTSEIFEEFFGLGSTLPSGIYTRTVGSDFCSGACGNAGNVSITTGSLILSSGAQINSGTSGTGQGGNIAINAVNAITMSGTMIDGTPSGIFSRTVGTAPVSGDGGKIALAAGQLVNLNEGATVSASSTGPGNTGNIQINAGQSFVATNSTVTTEATQAGGGTIKITTTPSGTVELTDSTISASVLDGTGGGGSVNIDPQFVILQNSQILAQAVQGPGGNISITTNLLLPDANSVISASSQFGVNGTVTIQSPNAPASGKIQPLGKTPLQATSLLNQHCAGLAGGEFSSFTVAGRDSLPTEPGSWLASPLALATLSAGTGLAARGEGLEGITLGASLEGETAWLSLRPIAPAGFLTQAFAVDWSAGCQS